MSLDLSYNKTFVQEYYNNKYSNFRMLPGFDWEKKKVQGVFTFLCRQIELIPGDKYLIDLGCGIGTKTYILSKFFKYSKGIDFSSHAIQIARLLNDNPDLMFEEGDIHQASLEIRYDVVTALGLSVLNVSSPEVYAREILHIIDKYMKRSGVLMVNSFTDFSGKAYTGWYCHTGSELRTLRKLLTEKGYHVKIIFPHRYLQYYFHLTLLPAFAEIVRLLISRRRQYYLIIRRHA